MKSRPAPRRAQPSRRSISGATVAVIALALGLRLAAIRWGLPDWNHFFSYHPDEFETAGRAIRILNTGDWNPEFFHYGSLFLYLTTILAWPFHALGLVTTVTGTHVVARVVAAMLGAATVLVVERTGRRLVGPRFAVLAALFLAVAPGHVLHSGFATVDVPATFFVALATHLALRARSTTARRDFLLAGAAAGLAAGTKYAAGLVLLAPLAAAWLLAGSAVRERVVRMAVVAAAAAAAFFVAVPYALVTPDRFRHDVLYELVEHPREGHLDIFTRTGDGWSYHLFGNLPYVFGVPLLLLAALGVARLARRRRPEDLVLLAFALPYFAGLGLSSVRFLRYTLPLAPALALAAASAIQALATTPRTRRLAAPFAGLGLAVAASLTGLQLVAMTRPDPRTRAAEWVAAHVPSGRTIGLPSVPWFATPPVSPWNGGERSRDRFMGESSAWRFALCETWDLATLERARPDVFVMSEFDVRDATRLHNASARRFLDALARDYDVGARFEGMSPSRRRFFGRAFAPHDWLYPFAEVDVWLRRGVLSSGAAE